MANTNNRIEEAESGPAGRDGPDLFRLLIGLAPLGLLLAGLLAILFLIAVMGD